MGKTAVVAALIALVMSGCGDSGTVTPRSSAPPSIATEPYSITGVGPYEVGVDMKPGVYIGGRNCLGSTAKTAEYDPGTESPDDDLFISSSVLVGDVQRIEVHRGEFFRSSTCEGWRREDGTHPRTPDPATIEGACVILGGGDLIQRAIDFLEAHSDADEAGGEGYEIQERLTSIVFSNIRAADDLKRLANAVGEFVDYLDAPKYFVNRDGKVDEDVEQMADRIDRICANS